MNDQLNIQQLFRVTEREDAQFTCVENGIEFDAKVGEGSTTYTYTDDDREITMTQATFFDLYKTKRFELTEEVKKPSKGRRRTKANKDEDSNDETPTEGDSE